MASPRPVIIVVPGASQSPSHYAYLIHLLQSQGWPTQSALLPSTGTYGKESTAENDVIFIRTHMLLPVLDVEKHNVILLLHSYSGMPGSAAALGLGKAERASKGKSTAVLGQIYISAMIPKGGDGQPIISLFGNQMPPHIVVDVSQAFKHTTRRPPKLPLPSIPCLRSSSNHTFSRKPKTCSDAPTRSHRYTTTCRTMWQTWP